MVSSHFGTPLGVGTSHGQLDSLDSPRPGLGGSHHLPPYSILCASPPRLHRSGSFSRDSEIVPGLWELITPDCKVGSWRGLNQTCSPRRALSNDVSHSQIECRKEVDSRLLVVESQIASLTPGPSFFHNLGCRCSNGQCEAIFDIYVSRTFQWHQEHLNARCFGPFCWTLNIWESRRTPNPQLWKCWASPHTWPKWGCDNITIDF
jgi:hypothetical protein